MPEIDLTQYQTPTNVNDTSQYPDIPGVDWNDATNRMGFIQNQANQFTNKMVSDSGDISQGRLQDILNSTLDDSTKDYLVQYYLGEKSNQAAWQRQMEASSTQYQRAVADLRKAGLNPFLAMQSLSGSSPSSSGQSVSGGLLTQNKNSKRDYQGNLMKVIALIAAAASRLLK